MLRALISALTATVLGVGLLGVGMSTSATAASPESAIELTTDLTLLVPRCDDCVITLFSDDGINPTYSSLPAAVVDGSVTITLPSVRTAGLSVRVSAPWAQAEDYDAFVAWRYSGTEIGDTVTLRDARSKRRASGCWAGTVNEAVTLKIKVRHVSFRVQPAAIAWAPVTESFVKPMTSIRHGVLISNEGLVCNLAG